MPARGWSPSFRPSLDTTSSLRPTPKKQKTKKQKTSPRQPSAELGGEEGEVGPCSASTLRLRLEKSPRVKHDLHQGRKKSIPSEGGWGGGLYLREMFGRGRGAFPTKAQNATLASSRGSAITTPALRPSVARPEGLLFCCKRQEV